MIENSPTGQPERRLPGGRADGGAIRVGETVRKRPGPNSTFVRELLLQFEKAGLDGVPRWLGVDDSGREVLSYLDGVVPQAAAAFALADDYIVSAARLIRRCHDASARTALAGTAEVVCHTDLGPHNTVFHGPRAVGVIDWDDAAPGSRLADIGHAVWCFADIDADGPELGEQARRVQLFCAGYGWPDLTAVIDEIENYHRSALANHQRAGRVKATAIFQSMLDWHLQNAPLIKRELADRAL